MKAITAPDRCNARVQRLARVQFVALPLELPPPSDIDRNRVGRILAALRNSVSASSAAWRRRGPR